MLPEEHQRAQPFEVDLDLELDLRPAGRSDRLADTVDYGAVTEAVAGRRGRPPRRPARAPGRAHRRRRPGQRGPARHRGHGHRAQDPAAGPLRAGLGRGDHPPPAGADAGPTPARPRAALTGDAGHAAPTPAGAGPGPPPAPGSGSRRSQALPPTAESALQERLTPRQPVRAFLGLGSNLGDRRAYLRDAVDRFPTSSAVSPLYETDPVGGPPGQGAYLNCVVELWTARTPRELLVVAQAAEAAAQRVRVERWGPRTLDVDVLLVGDETVDEPDLIVPHPRMWERGFVLVPLGDLAPELVLGHLTSELARGVRAAGNL